MRFFWLSLTSLCLGFPLFADKAVVEDFTDCGTWRNRERSGHRPGTWFSANQSLCGAPCKDRPDGYAGVVNYDFTGKHAVTGFERYKVLASASVYADAIEFAANRMGQDVKVRFILRDAKRKNIYTPFVTLKGLGWQNYRLMLNDKKMVLPVRLRRVIFAFNDAEKGHVLIDDIALCGDVSRKNRLTVKPVYRTISHAPGKDVKLSYLIRSGMSKNVQATVKLQVFDYNDRKVYESEKPVDVDGCGVKIADFDIGKHPIGAYYTKVNITCKKINNEFQGWFAVFVPNGKRLNHKPMYFGVQDTTSWNGPAENDLHLTWLKALGIDIVRYGTTGGRLDGMEKSVNFAPAFSQLKPILDAGILVCISYIESSPGWVQSAPYHYRRMPDKMDKFAEHMTRVGRFTADHPGIKYLEWWNEPDIGFLRDNLDNYLKCLKVAYTSLKKQNPELKVTTGGVTVKHPKEKKNFSRDMYWKGKGFYDVASFHAHGSLLNYTERDVLLDKWLSAKDINVPVCNTESGERSGYEVPSIKRQAEVLVKKLTYAKSRNTEFYIWFTLQDYWDMDEEADDSFGLITSDNQPKPSFVAYTNLIKQLAGTGRGRYAELDPAMDSYRFTNGTEAVYVCWPKIDGNTFLFSLKTDKPVTMVDFFGNEKFIPAKNGIVDIKSMKQPFYLRMPEGVLKGKVSLVKLSQLVFAGPGDKVDIRFAVSNPWSESVNVKIIDAKQQVAATAVIAPKTTRGLKVKTRIAANAPIKPLTLNYTAIFSGKGIARSIPVPVTINVAYKVLENNPEKLRAATLDCVREMTYDPAIPRWKGPDDLSAELQMTCEGKNLQVVVRVIDDIHCAKGTGTDIWRGDSLQFATMSQSGVHTELTLAKTSKGSEIWCHITPDKKLRGRWKVPVKITREKNKLTVYRFSLPLAYLGIKTGRGVPFRFSFLVNEDDRQGRVRWIKRFGGIGESKDPSLFGWAVIK